MLFRPLATKYQTKNSRALPDDSSLKYLRKGRPWNNSNVGHQQRIRWNDSSVEYQQRIRWNDSSVKTSKGPSGIITSRETGGDDQPCSKRRALWR